MQLGLNLDGTQHCFANGKPTMEPLKWSHFHNVRLVVPCLLQHTLGGIAGLQAVECTQQPAGGRLGSYAHTEIGQTGQRSVACNRP